MKRIAAFVVLLSAGSMIGACASGTGSAERGRAGFVNKVWRVSESSAVAPGTLYVFLSEGTLIITSEHSTPALGRWTQEGGALTMVEESIAYRVDILNLTDDEFRIRSHNPGGSVEIRLVPAHRISDHLPTK